MIVYNTYLKTEQLEITVCSMCGSIVLDTETHDKWHFFYEALNRRLSAVERHTPFIIG
jgi:hypothetical protein